MKEEEINKRIAKRARELRAESGLTLEEVAKKLRVNITTVSKAEHGKVTMTGGRIARLALVLGVSVSDIFAHVPGKRT